MRVPELKALAREHRLRGYSWMRRAELNELIRNDQRNTNTPLESWDPSITAQSTSTNSTRPERNSNLRTADPT